MSKKRLRYRFFLNNGGEMFVQRRAAIVWFLPFVRVWQTFHLYNEELYELDEKLNLAIEKITDLLTKRKEVEQFLKDKKKVVKASTDAGRGTSYPEYGKFDRKYLRIKKSFKRAPVTFWREALNPRYMKQFGLKGGDKQSTRERLGIGDHPSSGERTAYVLSDVKGLKGSFDGENFKIEKEVDNVREYVEPSKKSKKGKGKPSKERLQNILNHMDDDEE